MCAFLRDVLGRPYVEDALGGGAGWLIFKTGRSEMGVHPTHSVYDGKTYESSRHHLISLMCDDISLTVAEVNDELLGVGPDTPIREKPSF